MTQQGLNAVAQRRGRRRAAGTCAFHVEIDDAILETAESDVAAVVGDRGANPGLDQLLDGGDCGGIRLVEEFFAVLDLATASGDERSAAHQMLHDRARDQRFELLPFAGVFGHGDEIGAEKYAGYPGDAEQPFGKWR